MKIFQKIALVLGSFLLAMPLISQPPSQSATSSSESIANKRSYTYDSEDILVGLNLVQNSYFEYLSDATTIVNWKMYVTNNVDGGVGTEKTIGTTVTSGRRQIGGNSDVQIKDQSTGNGTFVSYLVMADRPKSFLSLAQTLTVDPNLVYTLKNDVRGTVGTKFSMHVYNNEHAAVSGWIADNVTEITTPINGSYVTNYVTFQSISNKATTRFRHYFNNSSASEINHKNTQLFLNATKSLPIRQEIKSNALKKYTRDLIELHNLNYDVDNLTSAVIDIIDEELNNITTANFTDTAAVKVVTDIAKELIKMGLIKKSNPKN